MEDVTDQKEVDRNCRYALVSARYAYILNDTHLQKENYCWPHPLFHKPHPFN